jgi:WD domain, G-beta repeat
VGELRWMVADAVDALEGLRRAFVEEGAVHRQQLDGTRQTLVAVAQLRQDLLALVAPGPAAPPEDGQRGDPVAAGGPPGAGGESPYPGLAGFQPEDAGWFFGREAVVAELLGRLSEQLAGGPPLALVGASGAGKSSVLRAGLLPALAAGALAGPAPGPAAADAAGWPWLLLTPGPRPLDELVGRTAALAGSAAAPAADRARQDPARFGELAALAGGSGRLVVVVDQLEELFTQGVDPAGQLAFATALASAAPALVVLALRADFYGQCLELPPLAGVLEAGQLLLGPMAVAELRRAVLEPAARAGLAVEPGLVELLLTDLGALSGPGYEPGALPLLGHALRATWERREAGRLTVAGYQATGGIRHAVAETAERTWLALDPDGRAALRELLLSLVAIADERVVRRRRPRSAVDPEPLGRLVEARLVTADAEQVELVHEALLTGWPRLEGWVAEARAQILAGQRLGEAARDWQAAGEDPDALYRGARLAAAREWAAGRAELPEPERRFLAASVAAAEAARLAERRAALRLRRLVAGLAVALVLAVGGGLAAVDQRGTAQDRERQARSRQLAAESLAAIEGDELGSMELALRAWSAWPTLEARSALLSAQTRGMPGRLGTRPGGLTVALSPDGGLVAVGHDDGRVRLWDTATLRQRGPDLVAADGGLGLITLAFSPDGRYLAATSLGSGVDTSLGDDGLRIWAMPGGKLLHALPGTGMVAWRPDSGAVLAGRLDLSDTARSELGVWEPRRGRRIGAVPVPEDFTFGLAVSPDGRHVAFAGSDVGTEVRRLADGAKVADLPRAVELVFLADGTLAGTDVSGGIRRWRLPEGRELPSLTAAGEGGALNRLEPTPEGTLLALGRAGSAESWAVPSGRRLVTSSASGDTQRCRRQRRRQGGGGHRRGRGDHPVAARHGHPHPPGYGRRPGLRPRGPPGERVVRRGGADLGRRRPQIDRGHQAGRAAEQPRRRAGRHPGRERRRRHRAGA